LAEADIRIPIIFMTAWRHSDVGQGNESWSRRLPDEAFRDQDILDAVIRALERDQKRRDSEKAVRNCDPFDSLTCASESDHTGRVPDE